jgi:GAF domain-containing protein
MDASERSAQLLAEFIAAVSAAETEAAAVRAAVERAAEALDADVAAIVCGGELLAAVGYPQGCAPTVELEAVRPGTADAWLQVPGIGSCAAAAATLEHPPGATLVLARAGRGGWSREETGLLRSMAKVAAMTMRMLSVQDAERSAREEAGRLARQQAALRRVAMLVARAASPGEIFSAVAEEVGQVLPGADMALVGRYAPGEAIEFVGGWTKAGEAAWVGRRVGLGGRNVATLVFETSAPARVDRLADDAAAVTAVARGSGARSSAGAPISVEGRLWGVMTVASVHEDGLPAGTEHRLAGFTELVATAIGEAQAREELGTLADEQAALRQVATIVARGEPPSTVFAAVAEEAGRLLPADLTLIGRYGPGDAVTDMALWSRTGASGPVGRRVSRRGRNVAALVFDTGRPARMDSYEETSGGSAANARDRGIRSSVGAPISVEGRVWGVMVAASTQAEPLPPGTETRLAAFTELVGTAIADAQARVELRGYVAEQAALRRVATLVARAPPPEEVFIAVTEEAGRLLAADLTAMTRYDPGNVATVVGAWNSTGATVPAPVGTQVSLGGRSVGTLVLQTGRPARIDDYARASGPTADLDRELGIRSVAGVPIRVAGRLWGLMSVYSTREEPLSADTEARLAGFTELVATAIANADTREEWRQAAAEQAALRRVATLVARGAPPAEVFAAVAQEVGRLFAAELSGVVRYGPDGTATAVGSWGRTGGTLAPYTVALGGRNVSTLVFETGRPARIDRYPANDPSAVTAGALGHGARSAVAVPISVEGRLWGAMQVASAREAGLPIGTEDRLAGFTELAATAIANSEAHTALVTSRARIAATADETRRRIERDLHDGAQQRLVSLALQLRAAQALVPPEFGQLEAELDRVATGLTGVLDELREYARGIHPAILAERGLGPALKALARRSPIPVRLDVRTDARLPERVEVTAYYVVSEALANVAKHANAAAVNIAADAAEGILQLTVSDDGAGGADPASGSGLVGLKDRVEAIGGTMTVQSRPGEGTRLAAELPVGVGPPPNPRQQQKRSRHNPGLDDLRDAR